MKYKGLNQLNIRGKFEIQVHKVLQVQQVIQGQQGQQEQTELTEQMGQMVLIEYEQQDHKVFNDCLELIDLIEQIELD